MKISTIILLVMSIPAWELRCSQDALSAEQFVDLLADDPVVKAFGTSEDVEDMQQSLTDITKILELADELLADHTLVNHKTATLAAHLATTVLTRKNHLQEQQTTLRAQDAIYETEVARNRQHYERILTEMGHYTKLMKETEQAMVEIDTLIQAAQAELGKLDCTDSPASLRDLAEQLLEEHIERKEGKESEYDGYIQNKKRLEAASRIAMSTFAEILVRKDSTTLELSMANSSMLELDGILAKIDKKYLNSSPALIKEKE